MTTIQKGGLASGVQPPKSAYDSASVNSKNLFVEFKKSHTYHLISHVISWSDASSSKFSGFM